jgi:hypothetical protein
MHIERRLSFDTQHMEIRVDQYPFIKNGKYTLPLALYYLGNDEKTYLCKFPYRVKIPSGYASCFKRLVDVRACKVYGGKTHDSKELGFEELKNLSTVIRETLC